MIIKKLNSVFHKHSRVLLLILAVLVIIPFVLGDMRSGGCSDPQSTVVGTALGEKVTVGDLRQFAQRFMLLAGQQNSDDWQSLFQRYCYVKYAEQAGVVVTDDEVAEQLRQIFRKDGKFSKADYDKFLADRKLTGGDVVDSLRLNLMIQKLQENVCRGVIVSDDEVRKFYELASPGFDLNVCTLPLNKFKVADPDEAALKNFYEDIRKINPQIPAFDEMKKNLPEMYKSFKQRENARKMADKEIKKLSALPVAERIAKFAALKFEHKPLTVPAAAAEMEKINKDITLAQIYQMFNLDLASMLSMLPEIEKSPNNQLAQFVLMRLNQSLIAGLPQELNLQTGDISRPLDLSDSIALVQVIKRKPADMKDFAKYQESLRKLMKNLKEQLAFQDFHNELMRQCTYTLETPAN